MMSINAALHRLVISSPQVERVGQFYTNTFGYVGTGDEMEWRGEAEDRSLWVRAGVANQLLESHFVFPDTSALEAYATSLTRSGVPHARGSAGSEPAIVIVDPDGRKICFAAQVGEVESPGGDAVSLPRAHLQHYGIRSPEPQVLVTFYSEVLGFRVSDLVRDDCGDLTAAFLRSDAHHHSLAIFRAPERRFDHFSSETRDWHGLRDWADHMAKLSIPLAWGVGRHGPGNDTFFMVYDPDGNLAEISSDLECCQDDRPVGIWKHSMQTLNQWGFAILRS